MEEGERWEGMDERYDDCSFEANRQKKTNSFRGVGTFYNMTLLSFFFSFSYGTQPIYIISKKFLFLSYLFFSKEYPSFWSNYLQLINAMPKDSVLCRFD